MSDDSLEAPLSRKRRKEAQRSAAQRTEFSQTRLSVTNLPDDTTSAVLQSLFADCPGVRSAFVVGDPAKGIACKGSGFVQFTTAAEAKDAVAKMHKKTFLERRLRVAFARRRLREGADEPREEEEKKRAKSDHSGRLIVRNLAFSATEKLLEERFGPFGEVTECRIVEKNGKKRGFGFVEFKNLKDARDAMEHLNGQELAGRTIAVDLCVPKNVFVQSAAAANDDDKEEEEEEEEEEEQEDEEDEKEAKASDEEPEEEVDLGALREKEKGRNVFLQNVPFEATKRDIIVALKQWGRIESVVIVRDKTTGRPRGTCFVVFATLESAKKCLEATGRGVHEDFRAKVLGRAIVAVEPIDASSAKNVSRKRGTEPGYERRNLALATVGRIDQDHPEWASLSTNDKTKRTSAITKKKEKLQNPNFAVSTVRLSVRNLPKVFDEAKLRHMFASGKAGALKQAVVVKDDAGVSKGYGFVEFKKHEDALKALHRVNNSPSFFGPNQRPIVEFAVDDLRKLRLRETKLNQKRERQEQKREEEPVDAEEAARAATAALQEKRKSRKLTKAKKREGKERAERRDAIKDAKRRRRAAKREKLASNAADDEFEMAAKLRTEKRRKAD